MTLAAAVVLFTASCLTAWVGTTATWSWQQSMLSDLGSATCLTRGGRWICSPRTAWFNTGTTLAGLCLFLASAWARAWWSTTLTAGMVSMGLGLALIGAFPSDVAHDVHMLGAVLALPIAAAGIMVDGIRARGGKGHTRSARSALAAVALTFCLPHLAPDASPIPRGAAELISVTALMLATAVEAWRCWTIPATVTRRADAASATPRPSPRPGRSSGPSAHRPDRTGR